MRKSLVWFFCITLSSLSSAESLPPPQDSCQVIDLQARYARLFAAGYSCGVDENSYYAKSVSMLFMNDQQNCKVSSELIDPMDSQIRLAIEEIESMPLQNQKYMCKTLDEDMTQLLLDEGLLNP